MSVLDKEIIYVADPMCSWCWGFAPAIKAIGEAARERAELRLVVGGLRPGTTEIMDDDAKGYIRHHWEEVNKASGQPFTFDFFERDGFVYDTEPACRAAVTVRKTKPDAVFPFMESMHRAFYVDNRDVTDAQVLADEAEKLDVPRDDFLTAFAAPEIAKETIDDFQYARSLGISGFPTVVVRDADGYAFLTVGFRPFEALQPLLEEWLQK